NSSRTICGRAIGGPALRTANAQRAHGSHIGVRSQLLAELAYEAFRPTVLKESVDVGSPLRRPAPQPSHGEWHLCVGLRRRSHIRRDARAVCSFSSRHTRFIFSLRLFLTLLCHGNSLPAPALRLRASANHHGTSGTGRT